MLVIQTSPFLLISASILYPVCERSYRAKMVPSCRRCHIDLIVVWYFVQNAFSYFYQNVDSYVLFVNHRECLWFQMMECLLALKCLIGATWWINLWLTVSITWINWVDLDCLTLKFDLELWQLWLGWRRRRR